MEISNSDKQSFLRCRRQWDFISHNRQGWRSIFPPPEHFLIGSVFHRILDAQVAGQNPYSIIDQEFDAEIRESEEGYIKKIGAGYSDSDLEGANKNRDLLKGMVKNYFDRYGSNPIGPQFRYVQTEVPWRAAIPTTNGFMRGTFDGVAQDLTTGDLWVVEHKTYSIAPSLENLLVDEQMTCYVWAAQKLLALPVIGVLYDGTRKKLPTEPRLLQNGTMSKQWIDTTEATYLHALHINGLEERDYTDFLKRLHDRDHEPQNPFFTRYKIPIAPAQVEEFEKALISTYQDMADPNIRIYPNRPWNGCWDCGIKAVCDAITFHEDLDFHMERYFQGKPYRTFQLEPISELTLDLEVPSQL